jgi:hypothetical protein
LIDKNNYVSLLGFGKLADNFPRTNVRQISKIVRQKKKEVLSAKFRNCPPNLEIVRQISEIVRQICPKKYNKNVFLMIYILKILKINKFKQFLKNQYVKLL